MNTISKNTFLPLGFVAAICISVAGFAAKTASEVAIIKTEISHQKEINHAQADILLRVSEELKEMNAILVRQETLLKHIEKKID